MNTAETFINMYGLQPHPEGGYFKETYRSEQTVCVIENNKAANGNRNICTAIYFLLEQGNFSGFHRIKSDEIWHFYAGSCLEIFLIDAQANLKIIPLGNNIAAGEVFQYTVPANCWFASKPAAHTNYSFVGCTVAPGFDFADFELASATTLQQQYPQHAAIIGALCRLP